uniref:Uncharacterized protein n=1 Tax=Alexandrium catenella TaxID=2925 RepID=A0A7S1QTS4_ALECA
MPVRVAALETLAFALSLCSLPPASGHRMLRHPDHQQLGDGANEVVAAIVQARRLCAVQGSEANSTATRHLPLKPDSLAEWKDEAQGCLTWCASLGDTCFRGCLDDCSQALGPPPCAGFAMQKSCFDGCNSLVPAFDCLQNVTANNTHTCHLHFDAALNLTGCPFR